MRQGPGRTPDDPSRYQSPYPSPYLLRYPSRCASRYPSRYLSHDPSRYLSRWLQNEGATALADVLASHGGLARLDLSANGIM